MKRGQFRAFAVFFNSRILASNKTQSRERVSVALLLWLKLLVCTVVSDVDVEEKSMIVSP